MTIRKIDLSAKLKGIDNKESPRLLAEILAEILLTGKGLFPSIAKNGNLGYGLQANPVLEVDEADLKTIIEGLKKLEHSHVFILFQLLQSLEFYDSKLFK